MWSCLIPCIMIMKKSLNYSGVLTNTYHLSHPEKQNGKRRNEQWKYYKRFEQEDLDNVDFILFTTSRENAEILRQLVELFSIQKLHHVSPDILGDAY